MGDFEIKKLRINSGWEKQGRKETDLRMEKERKEEKEKDLRHQDQANLREREREIQRQGQRKKEMETSTIGDKREKDFEKVKGRLKTIREGKKF